MLNHQWFSCLNSYKGSPLRNSKGAYCCSSANGT
nr:MAG TPA: hypothetical protein [Caudoviricetes sp.]